MNIGVFFTMRKVNGGAYQYAVTVLDVLKRNPHHRYVIFNYSPDLPAEYERLPNFEVVHFEETHREHGPLPRPGKILKSQVTQGKIILYLLLLRLKLFTLLALLTKKSQRHTIAAITAHHIDLALFTMSNKLAFLLDLPAIVPLHDINHKLHPEYPEFSSGKIWAQREYITVQTVKKAAKILVDSEVSREDLMTRYHARPDQLVVLPFLPPNYLKHTAAPERAEQFFGSKGIPEKFIFYPAALWPHKNHLNLVKAIGILKQNGMEVTLVLTGPKKEEFGVWDSLTRIAREHQITDLIKYLGYVDDDEIAMLYRHARAMVMPALVGPTYIPIYEAWALRCPVLCSDIRGLREQAGDAALLFNPEDLQDIADTIKRIWTDDRLRQDLVALGNTRLSLWTETDFRDKISQLIHEFTPLESPAIHGREGYENTLPR